MKTNLSRYKKELEDLQKIAAALEKDIIDALLQRRANPTANVSTSEFNLLFQSWFTEAQEVIRQLLPSRLDEFCSLYAAPKRKGITLESYSIQDWLLGRQVQADAFGKRDFDDLGVVLTKFRNQASILNAATRRFESSLFEIRQMLQADLFDSEIEAATALARNGFLRSAGALCGVILEAHLKEVLESHQLTITKKNPSLGDYFERLKAENVVDVPTWRHLQRLGDIRNLCDHKKEREPREDEIEDLIVGVKKVVSQVF